MQFTTYSRKDLNNDPLYFRVNYTYYNEELYLGGIQMKSKRITKESLMKGIKKITKHKLFKNKLYSSILMLIGLFSVKLLEGDITVFIFMLMIGLPVFFSKENVCTSSEYKERLCEFTACNELYHLFFVGELHKPTAFSVYAKSVMKLKTIVLEVFHSTRRISFHAPPLRWNVISSSCPLAIPRNRKTL